MKKEKFDKLNLDNQLCFPLYVAARQITSKYASILKPFGLTYTQYIVFLALWEKDKVTMGELGNRLHLDNGTLTPLLKKMETLGYIERCRCKEDERVVKIVLTKKGISLKDDVKNIPDEIGSCVNLTKDEMISLRKILDKIIVDK